MRNPLRWLMRSEAATYSLSDDNVLQAFFGALSAITSSGVRVTQENAVRSMAVLACLIVRAETFSALPVDVFRKSNGKRINDPSTAAARLLAVAPNEFMTAGELWRWKQIREDLTGNAMMRIEWGRAYTPAAIYPLTGANPRLVIDRKTRRSAYEYAGDDLTPGGVYAPRDVLHFKGAVLRSPFEGASLVDLASESIGVAIGSEQFFARLLGNGTHFPGYFETDNSLTPEDFAAIREQLAGAAGILGAGKVRIFDRGLKYKQNDMSLKDAELLDQQRWQLQQICSVFRVPLAAVQDLTNGTYTNSEQQDLWLGKHTITPIATNTERVIRARLFAETPDYEVKWNLDGLLRGDYATRTQGDATLVGAGIIDRNEARGHYDLNPREGLEKPLVQLGYGVVESDGTISNPSARTGGRRASDPAARAAAPAAEELLEPLLADAFEASRRRAERDCARGVPLEDTRTFILSRLAPLEAAHAAAGIPFDAELFAEAALSAPAPGDAGGMMGADGSGDAKGAGDE